MTRKFPRVLALAFGLALVPRLTAQDQTINGNLTVTGWIGATGAIDSDANALTFGTQSGGVGSSFFYADDAMPGGANDTFKYSLNRISASWLWQHGTSTLVPAMRLDAAHQLILYQSDGATAGIALSPASNSLKLGTHANGTFTADANGVITAGGGFTVVGNFTSLNGSFAGGSAGLTLNAGGANQAVTLNSSGTGDLIFKTNGSERARIKSSGNVGIGTPSPAAVLHLQNTNGGSMIRLQKTAASAGAYDLGVAANSDFLLDNAGVARLLTVTSAGKVGIGTMSPDYKLTLEAGGSSQTFRAHSAGDFIFALAGDGVAGTNLDLFSIRNNNTNVVHINSLNSARLALGASTGTSAGSTVESVSITAVGNVGIGISSPSDKLQVAGNISQVYAGRIDNALVDTSAGTNAKWWAWSLNGALGSNTFGLHTRDETGYFAQAAVQFNRSGSDISAVLFPNGNVGIGTTNPAAKLQVGGYTLIKDGNWDVPQAPGTVSPGERIVFYEDPNWKTAIGMDEQNGIWFQVHTPANQVAYQWFTGAATSAPTEKMRIMDNGNVGIGTINPTHKLAVNGTIRAKEIIVDTGWADYVFDESYRLAPLSEVESHIKSQKHLPGIPSAAEVAEHGVSMGDMQAKLLSKIEELTLHIIAQEKRLAAQDERIAQLEQVSTAHR